MYLVTLDRNNKETLTKLNSNMRIVLGNRLKLEPIPVTGWQFERWDVEGGIVTANNYFIVTDDTVNITAVFNKKHDTVPPPSSSGTSDPSNPYQPADDLETKQRELALAEAKYNLSVAQENLRQANVALENARKKTSYVFVDGDFKQIADQNAIAQAELNVQKAELDYRKAELAYQQLEAQLNSTTTSVYGDVDGDGEITFSDVEYFISLFLKGAEYSQKYDLSKDGYFDFDDISAIISIFLNTYN